MTPEGGVGGWWMASDGRWYPPEQHPDHVAQPPPAPTAAPTPTVRPPGPPPTPRATFASAPLPVSALPPGAKQRKTRYAGSRTWPVVTVVVVVMLAVVGGVAWFTVQNGKPAPVPKHVSLPPLPTVPPNSGSASGQSPTSPGAATGAATAPSGSTGPTAAPTTAAPAAAGGCTPDPAGGGCVSAGQPCPSSQADQTVSGAGGSFVCTERKITSDGGAQLPIGYFWQAG